MKSATVSQIAALVVAAIATWGASARAQEASVPRVIHYEGYLVQGTGPVTNQALSMTFTLHNCSMGNCTNYVVPPTPQSVNVSGGQFAVDLDVSSASANWIYDSPSGVYLGVSIDGAALNGRQKIQPVPYAVRSSEGYDFNVKRDLTVANNATCSQLNVQNAGSPGIELRSTAGGTPFVDFSNDSGTDFDARIRLTGNDELSLEGATLKTAAINVASGTVSVQGANVLAGCTWVSYRPTAGANEVSVICGPNPRPTNILRIYPYVFGGGCEPAGSATTTASYPREVCVSNPYGPGMICGIDTWVCKFSASGTHAASVLCCDQY